MTMYFFPWLYLCVAVRHSLICICWTLPISLEWNWFSCTVWSSQDVLEFGLQIFYWENLYIHLSGKVFSIVFFSLVYVGVTLKLAFYSESDCVPSFLYFTTLWIFMLLFWRLGQSWQWVHVVLSFSLLGTYFCFKFIACCTWV